MVANLKALVGRVNPVVRDALERACGRCLARKHHDVEVEHFLRELLELPDSDLHRIVQHFGVDKFRLSIELDRSLDRLKAGNPQTPKISWGLSEALTRGWEYGSLEHGSTRIRTGFVLVALVTDGKLSELMREFSKEVNKIDPKLLQSHFAAIVRGSGEDEPVTVPTDSSIGPTVSAGPRVFISYRRNDSVDAADYLFVCLRAEVPGVSVFRDSDTLRPGMLFARKIEESVAACDVLLALIGKKWLGTSENGTRRIDQEDDWVRREVAAALHQEKLVIPCLVGGAKMPARVELPPDLAGLAARHRVTLSRGDLRRDAKELIETLRSWRGKPETYVEVPPGFLTYSSISRTR